MNVNRGIWCALIVAVGCFALTAWIPACTWPLAIFVALIGGAVTYALSRREIKLQENQKLDAENLRGMLSILPGIWYENRIYPDGRRQLLQITESIREVLGVEPAELYKDLSPFFDRIHPDDKERILGGIVEHTRTLRPWCEDYRFLLPDRRVVWVKNYAKMTRLSDGSTIWRGYIVNINYRKESEEALRKSEARLALATRAGRVGTWDYDVIEQTISWNDVAYDIHGVSPKSYVPNPKNNPSLLHPDDLERVTAEFQRCLESDESNYEMECRIIRPDGSVRHTKSAAIILRDSAGGAIRVVGTELDVTEDKQLTDALAQARDRAEAATRVKSEFMAMMSHEIRTPMNGIMGFSALLKTTPLTEQQLDYLETIESSGEGLLLLIGDILDLSKIEAKQVRIESGWFDLHQCVREVAGWLRSRAVEKKITFKLDFSPDIPGFIRSDRLRMSQILTNLLGNAIKFTSIGGVTLKITAEAINGGPEHDWKFVVSDTGCGIQPEAMGALFTPFYQADSSSARRYGGSGLGLAISRRLAELISGQIAVTSELGQGSVFVFSMRAEASAKPKQLTAAPSEVPLSNSLAGKKILVVEDHPVNLKLCRLHLERLGCQVEIAETGFQALAKSQTGSFDAVLMDIQLPGLDGYETTKEIRLSEGPERRVPIIAMTANAMPEDRQICLDAGMDDYLSKPLKLEVLAAMLRKWLPG